MGASYNRYSDITASLTVSATGDTGTPATITGSAVVLDFDSIEIDDSLESIKSQGGQDPVAINRNGVEDFTITVNTKWGAGFTRPAIGKQAKLVIAYSGGATRTYQGMLRKVTISDKDDSTINFTLDAYGVAPVYA